MSRAAALLLAIVAAALAAVGSALVSQHVYGMQPCPWCVLQRLIFVAIAAVAPLGIVLAAAPLRRLAGVAVLALAGSGIAAALWQHFVAASSASCDMTLADRIVGATGLDARWPGLFMATASCAEAKVTMLGVPYEFFSLGMFVVVEALAVAVVLTRARRRR